MDSSLDHYILAQNPVVWLREQVEASKSPEMLAAFDEWERNSPLRYADQAFLTFLKVNSLDLAFSFALHQAELYLQHEAYTHKTNIHKTGEARRKNRALLTSVGAAICLADSLVRAQSLDALRQLSNEQGKGALL